MESTGFYDKIIKNSNKNVNVFLFNKIKTLMYNKVCKCCIIIDSSVINNLKGGKLRKGRNPMKPSQEIYSYGCQFRPFDRIQYGCEGGKQRQQPKPAEDANQQVSCKVMFITPLCLCITCCFPCIVVKSIKYWTSPTRLVCVPLTINGCPSWHASIYA